MNVVEALKVAGEGGKVRRPNWSPEAFLDVGPKGPTWMSLAMLLADDWEAIPAPPKPMTIVEATAKVVLDNARVRRRAWLPGASLSPSAHVYSLARADLIATDWEVTA